VSGQFYLLLIRKNQINMNEKEYILLYEKYISGLCNEEEKQTLYQYRDNFKLISDDETPISDGMTAQKDKIYKNIMVSLGDSKMISLDHPKKETFRFNFLLKIAAAILITGSCALLLFNFLEVKKETPSLATTTKGKAKITPGKSTATLTLSNGAVLDLDKYKGGLINKTGHTIINKTTDGAIVYSAQTNNAPADLAYHTINVPKGGNYTITLQDGTQVWLNSASSLTYPVSFNGKTRSVELKGEAYFEVAQNKKSPFIVNARQSKVTVLGTHFNVMAYENRPSVNTTLLEGSVRLSAGSQTAVLVPGEQGIADLNNARINVTKANINYAMAWKNGYFMFQNDTIEDIMEQISRWYDVEVEYRGDMRHKTFGGVYSKNKDLEELLKGLELTGIIHFKIEGRRIIVMA
jgi:transmembrane sensor